MRIPNTFTAHEGLNGASGLHRLWFAVSFDKGDIRRPKAAR